MHNSYYETRLAKIEQIAALQGRAYVDQSTKDCSCRTARELIDGHGLSIAGRVILKRDMGKMAFLHIADSTGNYQVCFKKDETNNYKEYLKLIDIGDHIGVKGVTFKTQRGEPTLMVKDCLILTKGLQNLPDKVEGLKDEEIKHRKRYLDLIANEETRLRFAARNTFLLCLREKMARGGFMEVETPILQTQACGANAEPFKTHHNSLDMDMYLRIAPETYLKRLIAGGYDKVFEIGKLFRNEGIDPSHLQEFTNIEWYAAYWNWKDNLNFTKSLVYSLIRRVQEAVYGNLNEEFEYQGTKINYGHWEQYTYAELFKKYLCIDLLFPQEKDGQDYKGSQLVCRAYLSSHLKVNGFDIDPDRYEEYYQLVEAAYKKFIRPKLINPTIITDYPSDLAPLARKNDDNNGTVDMFQIVINGWEIVKAYSELVDPIEQRKRLEAQAQDKEGMPLEEDFIECMEYGMPPISGGGLGIDRLVALLTNSANVRDVIYFPFSKVENL